MRQHTRPTSAFARRLLAPLLISASLVAALLPAVPAQAVTTIAKINFQPSTFTTPAGYTADTGLAYSAARGFGWIDQADSNPLDMTANMRSGNSIPPAYTKVSEMMMQPKGLPSGRWEYAIANGTYNVTLTVGDARMSSGTNYCCIDGTMRLSVEGVRVVNDFVASPATPLMTASANIAVSDGKLTIDAAGGVNTKLDHVEITSATGPAQGAPPQITGVTPAAGATQVALNTSISLALSEPVLPSSVTSANIVLTGPNGVVGGNYNADAAGGTASFTPSSDLAVDSLYTLHVTGLQAASGSTFPSFTSTFTTVNNAVHVNFQPGSVTPPAGYATDTGAAFNGQTGWQDLSGAPLDLTANTRVAHAAASPDVRYDTDLLMQAPAGSGTTTPGQWATSLSNGSYDVSVTVGDPLAFASTDEIIAQPGTANAVTVIDHYVPSAASPWQTITKRVSVTNGFLVLSPAGGTNTKIDFVDAVPAPTDTLPPTVTLSLAGSLTSGTTYSGPVTVSASSVDDVGVTSTAYVLDSAASTAYTAPVVVSAPGSHTITVTAKDAAGNPGSTSKTFSIVAPSGAGSLHVNFAAQTSAAVAGYTTDFGAAFSAASGSGWEDQTTGAPVSAIGNGRERNSSLSPDKRYDTLLQMQETPASTTGTHTPVRWEHAIANGTYAVTVAVGDSTATNSVDTITAEPGTANSTVIINAFQATSTVLFRTTTKTVTVSDGFLTLSAAGGSNTKIDYVDAVPLPVVDSTPPSAAITLNGTLTTGTTYSGPVAASVTSSDNVGGSGVATVTYSLDGQAPVAYGSAVQVATAGAHTFLVTVTDVAGNVFTTESDFSIVIPDTTKPTLSVALDGTLNATATAYVGDVTADVTDDDQGGSGLASTTYVLDSASSADVAVDGTITISGVGDHTLTVTATDGANNSTVDVKTFTIEAAPVDSTPPTASVALTGVGDGTNFTGIVTATLTAADEPGGSGLAPTTYLLDGTPGTYTAPIVVPAPGDHTLVVTVTDNAGNATLVTTTWHSDPAPVDTTPPTVDVELSGTPGTGDYIGDVTATVTAADEVGGSGLASTTYLLDGTGPFPYTAGVVVSAAGQHMITVTATDGAGNTTTVTKSWNSELIDATAPDVSFVLSGTLYSGTTYGGDVTVAAHVTDAGSGVNLGATTYVLDSLASAPYAGPVLVTGTGEHTLTVTAYDNQGNSVVAVQTWTQIAVDTTQPTASVTLSGTKSGASYVGSVTANLAAADEVGGSGLASATYVLDSASAKPLTATVVVPGAGQHTLMVTATDRAGNLSTASQSWTSVAVDTTPPTVSIGLAGALYTGTTYGGNVTVTITAADNAGGSGLAPVSYVLDGTTSPYTVPFTVSALGAHTLVVTATDNQNNSSGPVTRSWTQIAADTTKPTASVTLSGNKPASTYIGDVTATLTATDAGSGIASATYVLDAAAAKPVTAAPVVVSAAGSHTLTVTALDYAGNTTTAAQTWTSQLVDTVKPTVTIGLAGALYSGTRYGGNVTVTLTAADNVGGSGIAVTSYVLDGVTATYTAPFVVSTIGSHSLTANTTDNQGNAAIPASMTWSQQTPDVTKPTAAASLAGTQGTGGVYTGSVTVTVTSADEVGGSGLKATTYSLDGGAATPYTVPVVVTSAASHTLVVTVTDNAGNTGTTTTAWNQGTSGGSSKLVVTSPDDAVLANPSTPRLVFSAVRSLGATPAKAFTFTNNGSGTLLVSNLAIGGTNANNWKLDVGQATSLSIGPGGTATVSLLFTPTDPTGCASTASPYAIGDVDRNATLTYTTNDATAPTGSALLSGVNSCYVGGNNEPVLDQLLPVLGYTDVVDTQYIDHRYIGPLRYLQGTDEIQSPYFTVANAAQPVSVTPIAHYGSGSATAYQATGYYAQGSAMTSPKSACTSACKTLWQFPPDTINGSVVTYNQDQKLLPGVIGGTTFTGTGTFGFFSGDYSDVNFSDDGLNVGHDKSNNPLPVPHYTHGMRVFPAYGPGHVVIPNTYIIGIDLSRVPAYKNNDYQDIILLVRNVQPAVNQATVVTATNDVANLAAGGSVSPTCAVTGFDGVMVNTGGTQCNAADIGFTAAGLQLTSTAGQLPNGNQQNALYKSFDATRGAFTVDARVLGPISQLNSNYQQMAAFFGPDQSNFLKIEAEHNGSTGDPHLTMFYDVKGVTSSVATVSIPSPTTISTLDLIIKGNTTVPDPLPFGDTYGVHGFPLDELTVWYSINGAAPVQIGTTTEFPADVTGWFSRAAKAGILVSNSGSPTPITATFSRFAITAP